MESNCRIFDWESQKQFARLSGDYNPIHIDPIAARRTRVGAPIVHGVHSLIWILECLAKSGHDVAGAKTLRVNFVHPIYVGDAVRLDTSNSSQSTTRVRILVGETEVVVASIGFKDPPPTPLPERLAGYRRMIPPGLPNNIGIDEMNGLQGHLAFGPEFSEIETLFPAAVQSLGLSRIAALVSSSCLVGMVVPGLHSMYLGLEVSMSNGAGGVEDGIEFSVLSITPRFRAVRIGLRGEGIQGTLETVSRLQPVSQPSMDDVRRVVSRDEFQGANALVVGGSRGLGELTGKLVAAGGGRVLVTYVSGKADAGRVVDEISKIGASCKSMPYDIRQPAAEQLAAIELPPTQIYYFATPHIARRKTSTFDIGRWNEFNQFYISGFFDLVTECARLWPKGVRVFYPSTILVESKPGTNTEYAMSKAAAEVLCRDIAGLLPGVKVLTRRLPVLPTDQTNSVVPGKSLDPIEVLLPIVREMQA